VAVTAFAQFGVAMSAALVKLRGDARPVIDSAAQPHMAGLTPDDDAILAAAPGHRGDTRQCPQGVIVSPAQRFAGLGNQRGKDDPSDARQGSQDRHVALLGLLPRGAVSLILGNPVAKRVKTLVRLFDLAVHQREALRDCADVGTGGFGRPRGHCQRFLPQRRQHLGRGDPPDAMSPQDASTVLSRRRRAVAGVGAATHSWRNQSAARSSPIASACG